MTPASLALISSPVTEENESPLAKVPSSIVKKFGINEAELAKKKAECAALSFDTKENAEVAIESWRGMKNTLVAVEKRRVELKADSLQYGRDVDTAAKIISGMFEEVFNPLDAKKKAADKIKADAKAAKENAIRLENEERARLALVAREAEMKAAREAEEARLAEERRVFEAEKSAKAEADRIAKVEADRVAAELKAANDKLAAERAAFAKQQEEAAEAARKEAARIATEKAKADAIEAARLAKIQAEKDAAAKVEADRIATEEAAVIEAERQAKLAARLEALKPDKEKLTQWASKIQREANDGLTELSSQEANDFAVTMTIELCALVEKIKAFGGK